MSDSKGLLQASRGNDIPPLVLAQSSHTALSERLLIGNENNTATVMQVVLRDGLISFSRSKRGIRDIQLEDVVSVRRDGTYALVIHSYPMVASCCSAKREHSECRLESSRKEVVDEWLQQIEQRLWKQTKCAPASQRCLVLVNPASGSGNAKKVWNEQCVPVFLHSGMQFDVVETQYAGHAGELVQSLIFRAGNKASSSPPSPSSSSSSSPPSADAKCTTTTTSNGGSEYDSVVVVSGDGLMSEVLNGIMKRADWRAVLRDNAFGHIPGGSGNGLAKSATAVSGEPFDAVSMSFMICRQQTRRMDLYAARTTSSQGGGDESHVCWGFLGFYHGLVSDIDLESEALRCIGNARFTIYALLRMMFLRKYRGTLEYDGVAVYEGVHQESAARTRSVSTYSSVADSGSYSFSTCKPVQECHQCSQSSDQGLEELEAFRAAQTHTHTKPDDIESKLVSSSSPSSPSSSAVWKLVQGPFVMVTACSLPWIASDVNMTPFAHCSDGLLDLVYVTGDVGGCSLLSAFLKLEDGSHVTKRKGGPFTYVKCKAVRFTPGDCVGDDGQSSKLNVDGEEAPYGPTELRCFQAAINVFSQ